VLERTVSLQQSLIQSKTFVLTPVDLAMYELDVSADVSSVEAAMNRASASNWTGNGLNPRLLENLAYFAWPALAASPCQRRSAALPVIPTLASQFLGMDDGRGYFGTVERQQSCQIQNDKGHQQSSYLLTTANLKQSTH
jgi:hypothetical protein